MAETYDADRIIRSHYHDPSEAIWLATARRLGMTVRRSGDVYATHDGKGLLTLSDREGFDPDDTVAQMVFHEICHWIVNGVASFEEPDWGFELDWTVDWREYACQRLQAHLAREHGLERLLASTGTYRNYYDAVLADPTVALPEDDDDVMPQTEAAIHRASLPPFAPHLQDALRATAAIRQALTPFLDDYTPDHPSELPLIWR